ncbi:MAG TPA: carbonic anhydrase [Pirellulales bacterium]|nr:carbonic anhydrase [Pirellulales bacterium]
MKTIDYIYRFDPKNPTAKPVPPDAEAARRTLEDGNRMFSEWMESCRTGTFSSGEPRFVVPCNGLEVGMVRTKGAMPKPSPFAVVVGCSDARVPTEMLFGQGFNDLFVIRVAGNVLGDECLGSIDFALTALSESVKVVVMLGHSGCGAVTGAVDAYLQPLKFWSKSISPNLRQILQRIFVAVREAANGLEKVWGASARDMPGYRDALIEAAVCLNAAQAAYTLHLDVEKAGKWEIEVLYGVYNLFTHRISMPDKPGVSISDRPVNLVYAPTNPRDFNALALQVAERLRDAPLPGVRGAASLSAVLPGAELPGDNGVGTGPNSAEPVEEEEEDHERL